MGSRDIVVLFNLGARWGWVVYSTPLPLYPWKREPIPHVKDAA